MAEATQVADKTSGFLPAGVGHCVDDGGGVGAGQGHSPAAGYVA